MSGESNHVQQLMHELRNSAAFPHAVGEIELIQTHISLLFFAGEYVYKIKKPVDLGFLDYTTLDQRRQFCEEEVRLNRRLAPQTYLGVVAIRLAEDRSLHLDFDDTGDGEIIEYAVRMHRLPVDRMLDALLKHGDLDNAVLDDLAALLVEFHQNAATGHGVNAYAQPEEVHQQIEQTRSQLEPFVGKHNAVCSRAIFNHIHEKLMRSLNGHIARIRRRIDAGRIREGHGDLHAGNICVLDDRIVIYDCIEFNRKFRCRDVAAECAFLAMDLDHSGFRQHAQYFLNRYAELAGDADMLEITKLYKTYFAVVRALVEAIKSQEREVDPDARARALDLARSYMQLAASYTLGKALILMCGLPASGKSYAAKRIARSLGATVLRSDAIRKEVAGIARFQNADAQFYDEAFSDRVYDEMLQRAEAILSQGEIVVIDATMIRRNRREPYVDLAHTHDAPLLLVQIDADEDVIRRRMHERAQAESVSDADWGVYVQMRDASEKPTEFAEHQYLTTRSPIDETALISQVLEVLVQHDK